MPSTFSRNLRLERIATGEQAGTWGMTTNKNLDLIDDSIDGVTSITLSSASYKIDTIDGGVSDGRSKVLKFTGSLTADCRVTITPLDAEKHYIVINATSDPAAPGGPGKDIIFQQGAGVTYTLHGGYANIIYCDGTGDNSNVYGALENFQVKNLRVDGSLSAAAGLTVTGNISVTGSLAVSEAITVAGPGGLTTSYDILVGRNLKVNGTMQCEMGGAAATGDLLYRSAAGPLARLPIGTAGQYLRVVTGVPGWATVDTSLTINTTPVTGSVDGRILFVRAGKLSDSSWLGFDVNTGNFGAAGSINAGGALTGASVSVSGDVGGASLSVSGAIAGGALTCSTLSASGTVTVGSGGTGTINFSNAFTTSIVASAGNWTFTKSGTGAVWFMVNGMEMLRMHHTKHLMLACPPAPGDLNYAAIDAQMQNSQACLMWDEGRSTLVIRMKGSAGGMGQARITMIAP